ncbi:MAG: hypothetical protein ACTS10_23060, partial [Kiloniellales bacterium]
HAGAGPVSTGRFEGGKTVGRITRRGDVDRTGPGRVGVGASVLFVSLRVARRRMQRRGGRATRRIMRV